MKASYSGSTHYNYVGKAGAVEQGEAVPLRATTTSTLSDAEVIERVAHGEKELYAILIRRYGRTLYLAVRGYLHEQVEVEAAMEETYVRAYAKLDQFKGEPEFSIWLVRIGIQEALRQLSRSPENHAHPIPQVHSQRDQRALFSSRRHMNSH